MDKLQKYSKQVSLSEIGTEGQFKLLNSKIVIIGCGGLGSIAAAYLTGAGIGNLVLIDGDKVHNSNLHRQILFSENSKQFKSDELKGHLSKLNSDVEITSITKMAKESNIDKLIHGADMVLDCTDNIDSKYLIDKTCKMLKTPLIYGAIGKSTGYLSFFKNKSKSDINLTDIFPHQEIFNINNSSNGVFNTIAALIGVLQANEALKHLLGIKSTLNNELLIYDSFNLTQLKLRIKKI